VKSEAIKLIGVTEPVGSMIDKVNSLIPQETYKESAPEFEVNMIVG
jgi:hypothetical protein